MKNYAKLPLTSHPLNAAEREKLLDQIGYVLGYLGAPEDWGYESKLGQTTIRLMELRTAILREGSVPAERPPAMTHMEGDVEPWQP